MPEHQQDPRGEFTLDAAGRLLYDAERAIARLIEGAAGDGADDWTEVLVSVEPELSRGAVLALALDALGKLRARTLEEQATPIPEPQPGDLVPLDVLRRRIRAGLEDATSSLIHDPRFDVGDAHALKALAGAYTALGGDLELEHTVSGAEYNRLVAETATTTRRLTALRDAARELLATTTPVGVSTILTEVDTLEDLRAAFKRLDAAVNA